MQRLRTKIAEASKTTKDRFDEMVGKIRDSSTAFSNLSQIAGGALGGILGILGRVIGTVDTVISSVRSLTSMFQTIKKFFDSGGFESLFRGLGQATDMAGTAAGAAAGIGTAASGAAQGFSSVGTEAAGAAETASTAGAGMASTLSTVAAFAGVAAAAIALIGSAFKSATTLANRFYRRVISGGAAALKVIEAVNHAQSQIGPYGTGSTEHTGTSDATSGGYPHGTRGRFIDFGAGTPVTLHGKERVMTEREGRIEARADGRNLAELQQIRQLLADLPRTMRIAMQEAVLLQ
jgi:hypothetical protein